MCEFSYCFYESQCPVTIQFIYNMHCGQCTILCNWEWKHTYLLHYNSFWSYQKILTYTNKTDKRDICAEVSLYYAVMMDKKPKHIFILSPYWGEARNILYIKVIHYTLNTNESIHFKILLHFNVFQTYEMMLSNTNKTDKRDI